MLFPTNLKIHLSKKIYHTHILSPVPLKYLSWVNRSRVIKQNNRGAVCSGCCGVSHFKIKALIPSAAGRLGARGLSAEFFSSNSQQLKKASLPKIMPHPWENLLSMTYGSGPSPLLQGRTTVKSHSSPRAPSRIGWGLCCKRIPVEFLPWPSPASLPTPRCGFWEYSLVNPLVQIWVSESVSWRIQPTTMALPQDLWYRTKIRT